MGEYARKPYYEREAIFCKKTILNIREALGFGRMMKITTQRRHIQYVKPYAIEADSEQFYHYLAGFIGSEPPGASRKNRGQIYGRRSEDVSPDAPSAPHVFCDSGRSDLRIYDHPAAGGKLLLQIRSPGQNTGTAGAGRQILPPL